MHDEGFVLQNFFEGRDVAAEGIYDPCVLLKVRDLYKHELGCVAIFCMKLCIDTKVCMLIQNREDFSYHLISVNKV